MKTKFTLLAVLIAVFFSASAQQQITNGNFENWTGNAPNSWSTLDQLIFAASAGTESDTFVLKETTPLNVYSGVASAKITSQHSAVASGDLPGILSLGALGLGGAQGVYADGVPYTSRPDTLTFYAKYVPTGLDTAVFSFAFTKWDAVNNVRTLIAGNSPGYIYTIPPVSSNTNGLVPVQIAIHYLNNTVPDSFSLYFWSSGAAAAVHPGSTLWIDNASLTSNGLSTDVKNMTLNTTINLFPVPATTMLNVNVSDAMINNTYSIVDMQGRVVAGGVIENSSSHISVASFASGSYVYNIFDKDKKMMTQGKFTVTK